MPVQDVDVLQAKIDFYIKAGRFDVAENLVKHEIEKDALGQSLLYHMLALVYHRQSRFKEALDCFRQSLAIDPAFTEASLNLATTLADLGFYEDALKVYNESHKHHHIDPKLPLYVLKQLSESHHQNGLAYESLSLFQQAYSEYRQAILVSPTNKEVRISMAKLYLKDGQIDKVWQEINEVLRLEPNHAEARTLAGLVHFKNNQRDQAVDHWRIASQNGDIAARTYLKCSDN